MSEFDLHPDRLGTTDETGRRIFPQPADVRGKYRTRRNWVEAALILFFLVLPWIRIGGRQALLLDIANRHFEIFGLTLRAHDAPLLVFVLAIFFFGLFFATAMWGRVWCGWACPQTVFIDGVYRRIERWIEGGALERRRLDRAPWSLNKAWKRTLKWSAFTAVSLVVAHSFLAYFVGVEELAVMIRHSPFEHPSTFVFMAVMTLVLLFDFGWFREQFCVIACPYGRFQSVLMDSRSTIVAYDVDRGEPRATPQAKQLAKTHGGQLGDCVNCYRCVQVCPVGIDIRRGVQMECIACTACIDACDDVMTKIKKPVGLIRYDSLAGLQAAKEERKSGAATVTAGAVAAASGAGEAAATAVTPASRPRRSGFRLRPMAYASVVVASAVALTVALAKSNALKIEFYRAKETPYQVVDDRVINHFKLEISNASHAEHELSFASESSGVTVVTALSRFT